jgi:hypothetical protein
MGDDKARVTIEGGDEEPAVYMVKIRLCAACLEGTGSECHTPACALWLHNSPGMRVHPDLYEILGPG